VIGLRDRAWAEIDRRCDWLVGLCQETVRRPTENPPRTFGWTPARTLHCVHGRLAEAGDVEATLFEHACAPTYTSPDHPLARAVHRHATDVMGATPTFTITTGGTDGRFFRTRDVPTVIYGPRTHAVGGLNQFILVEDLVRVTKVHMATALEFVGDA
jgi:acetylornithine deacetylase/succinyl-diaminopimelate desuccinylase-like protein